MALVGVGTTGTGEGRGRGMGGIVPSGGNRYSHPVNPACYTGEHSYTQAAPAHTHTQRNNDRREKGMWTGVWYQRKRNSKTASWGSHTDTVRS